MLFSNQDLRRLIFPLIIEQILAVSVGMADTMMVSSVGLSLIHISARVRQPKRRASMDRCTRRGDT